MKMNWLRLEQRIREALENYEKDRLLGFNNTHEATIFLIDEILAEETRRGNSINQANNWTGR